MNSFFIRTAPSIFVLLYACSSKTTIEVSEYYPRISTSHYSKIYQSKNFDMKVSYVGMNDSAFTFEIRLHNRSDSLIALDCEQSKLDVIWCKETFRSRIKSYTVRNIEAKPSQTITVWFQFLTANDILPCFLNGGKITLTGIHILVKNQVFDFGVFEFQPVSLRLK